MIEPLSASMRDGLRMLADGPLPIGRVNAEGVIGGATARGMMQRGLAAPTKIAGVRSLALTKAGVEEAKRTKAPPSPLIDDRARSWEWRTWNLLEQIRAATDGECGWQKNKPDAMRVLGAHHGPKTQSLEKRGWIQGHGVEEIWNEDDGDLGMMPTWSITSSGRAALAAAHAEGITTR